MVYFEETIFDSQEEDKICFACNKDIEKPSKFKIYKICSEKDCNFHFHISAKERINLIIDSDIPAVLKLKEVKDNIPEVGSEIEALVTSIGRKDRLINLSIRAMEKAEEKSILKENLEKNKEIEASSKTSIGDLIKDEIEESSTKKDEEV